jgi:hypothetical protein
VSGKQVFEHAEGKAFAADVLRTRLFKNVEQLELRDTLRALLRKIRS